MKKILPGTFSIGAFFFFSENTWFLKNEITKKPNIFKNNKNHLLILFRKLIDYIETHRANWTSEKNLINIETNNINNNNNNNIKTPQLSPSIGTPVKKEGAKITSTPVKRESTPQSKPPIKSIPIEIQYVMYFLKFFPNFVL